MAAPPARPPSGLDGLVALLSYEGVGRELIVSLKYSNRRFGLERLAAALGVLVERERLDLLTWAPTSRAHRRSRGYDQAELLAKALARTTGLSCIPLLERLAGPAQTGRGRAERLCGSVRFDLRGDPAVARAALAGMRIAVVDDVMTTGATLSSAAVPLREVGVSGVIGAVLAVTPARP